METWGFLHKKLIMPHTNTKHVLGVRVWKEKVKTKRKEDED